MRRDVVKPMVHPNKNKVRLLRQAPLTDVRCQPRMKAQEKKIFSTFYGRHLIFDNSTRKGERIFSLNAAKNSVRDLNLAQSDLTGGGENSRYRAIKRWLYYSGF